MAQLPDSLEAFTRAFESQFTRADWTNASPTVVVALSGGLDSLVLLHLLRSHPELPEMDLHAAHFDHRMRPESGEDARWVEGLCQSWGVPLHLGLAESVPGSEDEAREMRYDFLLRVKKETDASYLLTAHHADDQAETVLFRIFRGTGLAGLAGIPRRRYPGIFRPLLPFPRSTLEEYAAVHGIIPRVDPSNADLSIPRNFLRHQVLPQVEEEVAQGARRSLNRLARLARENEKAWESLLPGILQGMERESDRGIIVVRSALLAYHPAVRARVLRHLLRRQGVTLSHTGTRGLLEFTRGGSSGKVHQLPGGLRLLREFDTFLLETDQEPGEDSSLLIPEAGVGRGRVRLGGQAVAVSWSHAPLDGFETQVSLDPELTAFPLRIRAWVPGDRISLPHGGKKLKKLFLEAQVPVGTRGQLPVLVDARGRVLWVSGVAVSTLAGEEDQKAPFFIGICNVDEP